MKLSCTEITPALQLTPHARFRWLVRPAPGDFHEDLNVHMADSVRKESGDGVLQGRATVNPDRNDFTRRIRIA